MVMGQVPSRAAPSLSRRAAFRYCPDRSRRGEIGMTIAEFCIFAVVAIYLLTIVPIKWIGYRHYDNSKPRDPAFYEDAIRARALGAHQNGIEAFPFFAAAVLLAEFRGAPQSLINELAVLFVIVRIA